MYFAASIELKYGKQISQSHMQLQHYIVKDIVLFPGNASEKVGLSYIGGLDCNTFHLTNSIVRSSYLGQYGICKHNAFTFLDVKNMYEITT